MQADCAGVKHGLLVWQPVYCHSLLGSGLQSGLGSEEDDEDDDEEDEEAEAEANALAQAMAASGDSDDDDDEEEEEAAAQVLYNSTAQCTQLHSCSRN